MPGEDERLNGNHAPPAADTDEGIDRKQPDTPHIDPDQVARLHERMAQQQRPEQPAAEEEPLPGLTETEMVQSEQAAREEAGPAPTARQQGEAILDAQVHPMMLVMVAGMAATTNLGPDVLFRSIMRVSARLAASMIAGDLVPVMKVRKSIKDALDDTLKGLPVKTPSITGKVPPHPGQGGILRN